MDEQTQSFLELTAKNDLVQLVADTRAAWLWSADGARILWANTAGAAFFAAQSVQDLSRLSALERSPARPHIARIADSGSTEKFSIDRLRFYRGLRVMLLTCQCKRLVLETGEAAALIVCGDKGLVTTKDPVQSFAHMLGTDTTTVFVTSGGTAEACYGALSGAPEDLDLPPGQNALFGPVELEGTYHEGAVVRISDRQKVVVLEDAPLADDAEGEAATAVADVPSENAATDTVFPGLPLPGDDETRLAADTAADDDAAWVRADEDDLETGAGDTGEPGLAASGNADREEEVPSPEDSPAGTPDVATAASEEEISDEDDGDEPTALGDASSLDMETSGERGRESDDTGSLEDVEAEDGFVFKPRRRPVRFAWKMDIGQRFTFLSDEFAEVLGPAAADIIGLTWEEVSDRFDLDPRGQISRALDRRDTWSGKTVNWPVGGAALRVPVDMAALPAFDRNRKFEGYRGFGVCRTADAVQDTGAPDLAGAVAPVADIADEVMDAAEPAAPREDETPAADMAAPDAVTADETHPRAAEEDRPSAAGDAPPAEAASQLQDLKPAQPDSFAGKTFLGASAAALVGSLARFTGKSGQQSAPDTPEPAETTETAAPPPADDTGLEDDKAVSSEEVIDGIEADADDLPGAALDSRLAALQTGQSIEPAETDDTPEAEAEAEEHAEAEAASPEAGLAQDDDALAEQEEDAAQDLDSQGGEESSNAAPAGTAEPDPDEVETLAGSSDETGDNGAESPVDAGDETPGTSSTTAAAAVSHDEPAGISGPAALKPDEIESAVKSLAKTYKAAEKKPRDLFEDMRGEDAAAAPEQADEPAGASIENTEDTEQSLEDAHFDIVDEDTRAVEATAADMEADEFTPESRADAKGVDETDTEEREFFQETGAFETEDKAAEDAADGDADEPRKTGEVIPLATARPRVVPVDTSGLSRPERQAFRKIAEALGARLEGDLADWDAPDPAPEPEDELPIEVPEAGPIDPSLLDRLPIGIAIVHDREVLYANKALLAMIGYNSVAKLCQVGGLEALFIDDAEELPDAEGMDGEVDEAMKLRLADGGVLNVDAHMHSVPWNGSQGLMISITERQPKPAAAAPAAPASPNFFAEVRSELDSARGQIAEMDTILETATDGVLVLDQHGTILKVNGSAEALFSANRSDMIGAPFTDFLAPESHRAAADYLDGLSRNGVASILNDGREVLGKVPTGGLIPLFMTMGRISGNQDEAKYCAVLRDITQWKTAEEELTQAKRQAENASSAKSDFLAKISHEIRTPLNAIIGFSEVMMEERFGPIGNDRYKEYLKDIRTSGSHIMSLINDLLDLSKIEAGKLDLKFSAVSTNDVINECVALMQPQANRERVIIRASLPDSVPDVVADPRSLRQIVLNLLSNAIKYNRSGGQVILSTALEGNGEVALRVRDTGTGMTAKQLTAALEPFRQLHTASRGGGTGLGLPLTKALVEANRASFRIDSTPDQGTLVEIVFPTQRVLSE
jgi:PAS domain S-box-containing protein